MSKNDDENAPNPSPNDQPDSQGGHDQVHATQALVEDLMSSLQQEWPTVPLVYEDIYTIKHLLVMCGLFLLSIMMLLRNYKRRTNKHKSVRYDYKTELM